MFLRDDSGIHDENSFVALVWLNFWHGQPLCQKGIGVRLEKRDFVVLRARALASLVELLEEKGILTQEEYEKRIMEKVKVK